MMTCRSGCAPPFQKSRSAPDYSSVSYTTQLLMNIYLLAVALANMKLPWVAAWNLNQYTALVVTMQQYHKWGKIH